jgi:hypothetical protein
MFGSLAYMALTDLNDEVFSIWVNAFCNYLSLFMVKPFGGEVRWYRISRNFTRLGLLGSNGA